MRKYWQIPASYVLHKVGHLISMLMGPVANLEDENGEPHWAFEWIYPAYQWCLGKSSDLDEWGVLWKPVNESEEDTLP